MDIGKEFAGVPFRIGGRDKKGLDCYGLVRLVLQGEKEIEMPLYEGIHEYQEAEERLLETSLTVEIEEPENMALAVIRKPGKRTHVGIIKDNTLYQMTFNGLTATPWHSIKRKPNLYRFYGPEGVLDCLK